MKAMIAMSGGVDSSVAAYLMQQRGYQCTGAMMQLFCKADEQDIQDAQQVASRLGIPFQLLNYSTQFRRQVMEYFACAYEHGQTPNPCVECNRTLKFGALYDEAMRQGCDCLVTGHYARIALQNGRPVLKRAVNLEKDQSYFLYMLSQEQLRHVCFPLGEMTKEQTRAIAAEQGFLTARKHDSQDICFVPDGDYTRVIADLHRAPCPEGDFVGESGRVLGRHRGISHYTLGQRRGLGISSDARLYVTGLDPERNLVILGRNEQLFSRELDASGFCWSGCDAPTAPLRVMAKIRYRHIPQWAEATVRQDGTVHLLFDAPQRAITRGQAVVLYDGDTVLGGGTIL